MSEQGQPLVLASGSPRRKQIFQMLGFPFVVASAGVDERAIQYRVPRELAIKAAYSKAGEVAKRFETGRLIVAADTIVVLGDRVYGKPDSEAEARLFLEQLSGQVHKVITGIAVQEAGKAALLDAVISEVQFRDLSSSEIDSYVATGEPMDKAGAYAIQGAGEGMVARISGDYFNVVGLPAVQLFQMLNGFMDVEPYRSALRNLTPQAFAEWKES